MRLKPIVYKAVATVVVAALAVPAMHWMGSHREQRLDVQTPLTQPGSAAVEAHNAPPKPAVVDRHISYAPTAYRRPAAAAAPYTSVGHGTHTALIVGINDTDPSNPLNGGQADATNMRTALLKYGFHSEDIVMLLNGDATRSRILYELRRLADRTPSNGLAVFSASSHGAGSSFRAGDGGRIYASEVGATLGRIRAPVWTALAVCYAAGFSVPGIVGPNRVATFSSRADQLTYEEGSAGSELFIEMIKHGMIDGKAPKSVESAFNYAYAKLAPSHPNSTPVISDGFAGDLVLGPVSWPAPAQPAPKPAQQPAQPPPASTAAPDPTPQPQPTSCFIFCH